MSNLDTTKSFAEDKINQAQERLELRSSSIAGRMNMYDLDKAIENLEKALKNLRKVKEARESEEE